MYTVFVCAKVPTRRRPAVQFFYSLNRLGDAVQLARFTRETFGCPAWVADYDQPADVVHIAWLAKREAERAANQAPAESPK